MKLLTFEYPYLLKILFLIIPLLAGTAWYFYSMYPLWGTKNFIDHFFDKARTLHQQGKPTDAKKEYLRLLKHDPECAPAHFNLAQLYAGDKEWELACPHYEQALKNIHPLQRPLVHFCYGTALFRLNNLEQARTQLDEAIKLEPTDKAIMQRSLVLQQLGNLELAKKDLDTAAQQNPDYIRGYIELGNKFRDAYKFENAIECYQTKIKHDPNDYFSYLMLGDVLHLHAKQSGNDTLLPEAMRMYEQAIACNPACYQAQLNLGLMHMENDDDETAMELFKQAYHNNPDFTFTNIAKGICHIKRQELIEGWDGFEWRTQLEPTRLDNFPRWDGKTSLVHKTILLHTEQGLGDTFHFVRFAQMVKQKGAHVILQCQPSLTRILSLCPYIDKIIAETDPIPAFDYQLPLLSIPAVLKTSIQELPNNTPYLYAEQGLISYWEKQLAQDANFKIGICWRVLDHHDVMKYANNNLKIKIPVPRRSMDLELFKPLAQMKGISLYSLQLNADNEKCHELQIHTINKLDIDGGFVDTAAIIKNLDLVITIDTSIAHLAGALGAPTWILLPFAAEWRWMKDEKYTPWYPTAQLFRCHKKGDWIEVMQRVCNELKPLIEQHKNNIH